MQRNALQRATTRTRYLTQITLAITVFCFVTAGKIAQAETASESLGGFEFRGMDRPASAWIDTLDRWLKDHRKATGQTFVYIVQSPRAPESQALHELASLPMTQAERKDACVLLNPIVPDGSDEIQSQHLIQECGLGATSLMENQSLEAARQGLDDIHLDFRSWEARTAWIILELLKAADSPILNRELQNENPEPADLFRYITRWDEIATQAEAEEVPSNFDPELILEQEHLIPRSKVRAFSGSLFRSIPDLAYVIVILALLLLAWKMGKIARTPAFRVTPSGLFRVRLTDRIQDRLKTRTRQLARRQPTQSHFNSLSEEMHGRI